MSSFIQMHTPPYYDSAYASVSETMMANETSL